MLLLRVIIILDIITFFIHLINPFLQRAAMLALQALYYL